ncbi:GntR family transcriptional repressor for pyruvate dehydrogenase complex [Arthrobacter ginsengisoli]|uniref:GntR family transcriptional repressor for pyruvate dehydrogenase complex n=1 Tax=Arthrobacter ginsengisoli TaxID=1356565 RepID=A0ABU1UG21_9MICC|nr:FCD domain-containing protein [Arthrobacter ginsengisoli]MDR7084133.1 GntR family transcriptional repressor for pyruvate dehydrogenase complex [Arthrobacter ginsengisoli]
MKKFVAGSIPMHDQVRDYLLDQIQDGVLEPGQALAPERRLAEEMGVSRHTVRQALSSLEGFGLIEIRHGSGIYVTESASDEAIMRVAETIIDREGSIPKIAEVRRGIEPYIARLAAERRTEENLRILEPLTKYIRDEDAQEAGVESTSFHREIAKASQNLVFDGVMRTLITGPRRAEGLLKVVPAARGQWELEHRDIFLAIKDGDGDRAEALMAAHMESVLAAVQALDKARAL